MAFARCGCATLAALLFATAATGQASRSRQHHSAATKPASPPAAPAPKTGPNVEAIRANNIGMALMERGEFSGALVRFQTACIMAPDSDVGCLNMGIALLKMQQYDEARKVLAKSAERDPKSERAWVNLALLEQAAGNPGAVEKDFQEAAALLPGGLDDASREKYSQPDEMSDPSAKVAPAIPVHFVNVTALSGLPQTRAERAAVKAPSTRLADFVGSGACVFDYDGDGQPDVLLLDADGKGHAALYRSIGKGRFADATKAAKLDMPDGSLGCAVGDYDNDGRADLAVNSPGGVRLFHNEGDDSFRDVTAQAQIAPDPEDAVTLGLTFLDADRDGDLDLYAARFPDLMLDHPKQPFQFPEDLMAPGNVLWRSAGSGKFVDGTKEAGLAGGGASVGALAVDLDGDGATDLVAGGWQKVPQVLLNQREGPFRATDPWSGYAPGPVAGAVALDFDHDGRMDLALARWAPPGLSLWRNVDGKSFERVKLPEIGWMRGWGIAAVDYDNDGWVDLAAVGETFAGEGRIILLRNEGPTGFRDVTHETGLDKIVLHNPRSVIAFDSEGDGAMDLLITQNHLPPVLLKNTGGNKNGWMELALSGDRDNKMGLGARVQVLSGAQKQTFAVSGGSGYLGQGPAEIHVGLGGEFVADVVRVRWPAGGVQNELTISGGKRSVIEEHEPARSIR